VAVRPMATVVTQTAYANSLVIVESLELWDEQEL
jgi:hypothetical protein